MNYQYNKILHVKTTAFFIIVLLASMVFALRWMLFWRGGNRFEVVEADELGGSEAHKKILSVLLTLRRTHFYRFWGRMASEVKLELRDDFPPENPPRQGDDEVSVDGQGASDLVAVRSHDWSGSC